MKRKWNGNGNLRRLEVFCGYHGTAVRGEEEGKGGKGRSERSSSGRVYTHVAPLPELTESMDKV